MRPGVTILTSSAQHGFSPMPDLSCDSLLPELVVVDLLATALQLQPYTSLEHARIHVATTESPAATRLGNAARTLLPDHPQMELHCMRSSRPTFTPNFKNNSLNNRSLLTTVELYP